MQTVVCWQMFIKPPRGGKAVVWSICKFLWHKSLIMVDSKLPTQFLKYLFIYYVFKIKV